MLVSALFALVLAQDMKSSLHFVPKAKESWSYRVRIQATGEMAFQGSAKFVFSARSVAVDGSWSNAMEASEVVVDADGQPEDGVGHEMTVERDAFGVLKDWTSYDLREMIGFDALELVQGFAPPAPVAVGESWEGRVPGKSEFKPFRFTYGGEEKVEGKSLLKLTVKGATPTLSDLEGTVWLSPDRYRMVRFALASTQKVDGRPAFTLKFDPAE